MPWWDGYLGVDVRAFKGVLPVGRVEERSLVSVSILVILEQLLVSPSCLIVLVVGRYEWMVGLYPSAAEFVR